MSLKYYLNIFLLLILFYPAKAESQNNNTEAALYNIGVGAIFSTIGAVINKPNDKKVGEVLLKSLAQGALGGYLVYESKRHIGKISRYEKLEYGWTGKILNSTGISIIENAAQNRNFWEQWNLNIGFNRIEFELADGIRVRYKIMPVAFLLTAYTASQYHFKGGLSLRTGEFVFSGNNLRNRGLPVNGLTIGTSIILGRDNPNDFQTISHEIIHVYQYHDFNVFNAYLNKPQAIVEQNSKFLKRMGGFLHYDFNYFIFGGLYLAEFHRVEINSLEDYNKNFFEKEADFYSRF
ncbi:hypothetical protein ACW6QP_14435 [Salegentibacter sp. HM20]